MTKLIGRTFFFGSLLVYGAFLAASCSGDPAAEAICVPGDNVFCRCRGGRAGTKMCLEDGNSFGPCETDSGECAEQPSGPSTNGSPSSSGTGPKPNPGELLAACSSDDECESGSCPMGFCTKGCDSYDQCAPPEPAGPGDCVAVPGADLGSPGICVPYCIQQSDCADYGPDSKCSFTEDSFPAYPIVVCADWESVTLPPDGYPAPDYICTDDVVCTLGLADTGRICGADGTCEDGGSMMSACTAGLCDDCPGIPIDLAMGQTVMRSDDTSQMPAPGEHNGENAMMPGQNCSYGDNGEEIVYAVTNTDSNGGYLTVDVSLSSTSSYDPALYVRANPGGCSAGTQLACSDTVGEGNGEIIQTYVLAGETVWVFVDGFQSSGAYDVTFNLDPNM